MFGKLSKPALNPKTKTLNLESFPNLLVAEIQPSHCCVMEFLKEVFRPVFKSQLSRKTARGWKIELIEG
jgi:hypothetical protein